MMNHVASSLGEKVEREINTRGRKKEGHRLLGGKSEKFIFQRIKSFCVSTGKKRERNRQRIGDIKKEREMYTYVY